MTEQNLSAPEPLPIGRLASLDGAGSLILDAVKTATALIRAEPITIADPRDGSQALAVAHDRGVSFVDAEGFDAFRSAPLRRTGTAKHTRLDSFIAHVLRFKADNSAVFASDDAKAPSLTAIFDYHPDGPNNAEARFGGHRARYDFPLSEEWKAWAENDGKPLSMADFAAFLEDRIVDVVAGPSKLIEIARTLQVNEASTFREARNLSSGEAEVMFTSTHLDAAGNKLVLPNLFMICIPVFARSPDYWKVLARFRYRKQGGGIVFWYELWRIDLVFEEAFQQACNEVVEKTALPLFVASPEA